MESINTTKLDIHYYLFIGDILFITLHSFMSDDGVRLHMKASDVSVSSSLVFFGNSVQYMCSSASYRIITKTQILGAQAHIFTLF